MAAAQHKEQSGLSRHCCTTHALRSFPHAGVHLTQNMRTRHTCLYHSSTDCIEQETSLTSQAMSCITGCARIREARQPSLLPGVTHHIADVSPQALAVDGRDPLYPHTHRHTLWCPLPVANTWCSMPRLAGPQYHQLLTRANSAQVDGRLASFRDSRCMCKHLLQALRMCTWPMCQPMRAVPAGIRLRHAGCCT